MPDTYGISGYSSLIFDAAQMNIFGGCSVDDNYMAWTNNSWISVKYILNEGKLIFDYTNLNHNHATYQLLLPMNNEDITHFYPCLGLREQGDECEITDVIVE